MGIDIGTTNCKIGIYRTNGEPVASRYFPTPVHSARPGWAEYSMSRLWQDLCDAIRSFPLAIRSSVKAMGISSQGESGLLVDGEGTPLMDAIAWYDNRTLPELQRVSLSAKEVFAVTGFHPSSNYSLYKLSWLQRHQPDLVERADQWHCLNDYLVRKLTGTVCMELSSASRTMALDLHKREWSGPLLSSAGIPRHLLPQLVPSGASAGPLLPSAAKALGLGKAVNVTAAGFDHAVGCLGIGCSGENEVVASVGTTVSVCRLRSRPHLEDGFIGNVNGCHVYPQQYYEIGGNPSGGQTVDWAIRNLLGEEPSPAGYQQFAELCQGSDPGAGGILFLPHLEGCCAPVMDPSARASFAGITAASTRNDLCRSVVEGLCFEFRLLLDGTGGPPVQRIRAIGGGVKNEFWMQCKADVSGLPVEVPEIEDAVTYGAAIAAGIAAGLRTFEDTGDSYPVPCRVYTPDSARHRRYDQIYREVYRHWYPLQTQIDTRLTQTPDEDGGR